jgi:hypothetical protein
MILEYIGPDTGQMLSSSWEKHRNDPFRRQNLFRGMARLMLSLAKILSLESAHSSLVSLVSLVSPVNVGFPELTSLHTKCNEKSKEICQVESFVILMDSMNLTYCGC